ncbi:MAG: phosphotransferase [Actinomycetota bacterium]
MERTRRVTLVVVDPDGTVRGVTSPLTISPPWWQEVGSIAAAVPGTTVLRLLEGTPDETGHMGGEVTYLVQHDDRLGPCPPLQPWAGELVDHPLRLPWARPGGPAADLDWVGSVVEVVGPPRQDRTWNLSAIWSIPAVVDGDRTTVWLKCVPPFFAHEANVLRLLDDRPLPRVIAAADHRILLAELPGEDGYDAGEAEQRSMVETLVHTQAASADRIDRLLAAGVPDHRAEPLTVALTELVARLAPDRDGLRLLVAQLPDRFAAVAATGLPDTIVHGDPHGGNCRRGTDPPIWFDWGDSTIGNPLLDLAATHRMADTTVRHWVDRWRQVVPGADPTSAWLALEPVARLREAWVYQRFLDNIEPAERCYHHRDVPAALDQAEAAVVSWTG